MPSVQLRWLLSPHLRAPAQGARPYANICERCPIRANASHLGVLATERVDA